MVSIQASLQQPFNMTVMRSREKEIGNRQRKENIKHLCDNKHECRSSIPGFHQERQVCLQTDADESECK